MAKIILFIVALSSVSLKCYFNKFQKNLIKTEDPFDYKGSFKYKSIFELSIDTFNDRSVKVHVNNLHNKAAFTDTSFQIYEFDDKLEFSNGADISYRLPIILSSITTQKGITLTCKCDDCKKYHSNEYISILWVYDIDLLKSKSDLFDGRYRVRSEDFQYAKGCILIKINQIIKEKRFEINIKEF
jgi:hypothetical protein